MKFFTTILSFYILSLTIAPCVDVLYDDNFHEVELSVDMNHNQHNGFDHCTPFCTCDCCVSPVLHQEFTIQFNSYTLAYKHLTKYFSDYNFSVYTSIWQPPKYS